MYKAVIFDLDGTLLNTLDDLANSVNFALRSFSYPEKTTEQIRRFVGNGVIKLMQRATPDGILQTDFEKCFSCFKEHYLEHMSDNTKPYDGVCEMLEQLKKAGVKTAVVSNKLHSGVTGLCQGFFGDLISCAFGVSVESERKPAPTNVFKAFSALGVCGDECIYVGDSEVDIQTADNAKIPCIGVTWGFRDKEELLQGGAKYIADTAQQVVKIVTE